MQKRKKFQWTTQHQKVFTQIKVTLIPTYALTFFNSSFPTEIVYNVSPVELGAVPTQQQPCGTFKPLSDASSVEQRHSEIERQTLAPNRQ